MSGNGASCSTSSAPERQTRSLPGCKGQRPEAPMGKLGKSLASGVDSFYDRVGRGNSDFGAESGFSTTPTSILTTSPVGPLMPFGASWAGDPRDADHVPAPKPTPDRNRRRSEHRPALIRVARLWHAAGAVEKLAPVAAQGRDLDDGAGVRGVGELAAADVDPDVAEAVEEDEVTRLERARRDRDRRVPLRDGVVRQGDAEVARTRR